MRPLLPAIVVLCLATLAQAQQAEDSNIVKRADAPKEVLAAAACDEVLDYVTREPFAGGWLWQSKCPSNHANEIAAQIFSLDKNGKGARLIRFPTPSGARLDEISNVEVFPTTNEFNALFINPEDKRICRTEARWIAKDPLKPRLVFWRVTKDCDGKKGWQVIVNRKT